MDGNAKRLFNARLNAQPFGSVSKVLEWIGKTFNLAEIRKRTYKEIMYFSINNTSSLISAMDLFNYKIRLHDQAAKYTIEPILSNTIIPTSQLINKFINGLHPTLRKDVTDYMNLHSNYPREIEDLRELCEIIENKRKSLHAYDALTNDHTDPTKLQKSNINVIENENNINYVQNNDNNTNPYNSNIPNGNINKNLYQTVKIFNAVKFAGKICNKCGVYGHDEKDCAFYHKLYKNYLTNAKAANERYHNGNYNNNKKGWNRFNNKRNNENKNNFKTKSYDKKQEIPNEISNIDTEPFPILKPLFDRNKS
jgi:hypothetical protein